MDSRQWLKQNKSFLKTIDSYIHLFLKSVDIAPTKLRSSVRGGVALLVFNAILPYMEEINVDSKRIVDIKLSLPSSEPLFIFSVYMPASSLPFEIFSETLELLEELYDSYKELGTVIVMGDMNTVTKFHGPRYPCKLDKRSLALTQVLDSNRPISLHIQRFGLGPVRNFSFCIIQSLS